MVSFLNQFAVGLFDLAGLFGERFLVGLHLGEHLLHAEVFAGKMLFGVGQNVGGHADAFRRQQRVGSAWTAYVQDKQWLEGVDVEADGGVRHLRMLLDVVFHHAEMRRRDRDGLPFEERGENGAGDGAALQWIRSRTEFVQKDERRAVPCFF